MFSFKSTEDNYFVFAVLKKILQLLIQNKLQNIKDSIGNPPFKSDPFRFKMQVQ